MPKIKFFLLAILVIGIMAISNNYYDYYNQRYFVDSLFGNVNSGSMIKPEYATQGWKLDWPYPLLTVLFVLPAKFVYDLSGSEAVYNIIFKSTLLLTAYLFYIWSRKIVRDRQSLLTNFIKNPGVWMMVLLLGGYDSLTYFFLPLSLFLYTKEKYLQSFFLLGLITAVRIYPGVVFPILIIPLIKKENWHKVFNYSLAFALLPIISIGSMYLLPTQLHEVIKTKQLETGPFGIYPVMDFLNSLFGKLTDFRLSSTALFNSLIITTLAGELSLMIFSKKLKLKTVDAAILGLIILFLFYPKIHGLYATIFIPLGLIFPKWEKLKYVWIPGFLWMLIVNGTVDAQGLSYFFYWITDFGLTINPFYSKYITLILATGQQVVFVWATAKRFNFRIR